MIYSNIIEDRLIYVMKVARNIDMCRVNYKVSGDL